jgi:hypothetical protein
MRRTLFDRVKHLEDPIYSMLPGEPTLEDGVLYVVDGPHYVEYNCPCGCGNVVMIPYFKDMADRGDYGWGMTEHDGKVSLTPSVFSSSWPCRSHYFIRQNRIEWCG